MSQEFDRLAIRRKRIFLDTARSLDKQSIAFTHARIDASSNTAVAAIRLHSSDNEPISIFNGRRLKNFKVTQIFIDNTAQPGQWVDIIFWGGVLTGAPEIEDDALTATLAGSISIDDSTPIEVNHAAGIPSIIAPLALFPIPSDATIYTRATASAALNTVVLPAANLNGIEIYSCYTIYPNGAISVLGKTSAPTNIYDGVIIKASHGSVAADPDGIGRFPMLLAAGFGLYELASGAAAQSTCSIAYKVL